MATPSVGTRSSQDALDAFVTTQLIDNGMDTVAKKINRLYGKLQRSQGDDAAQKKYAKQLHHYLTLGCRLLAKQRDDVSECIGTIERDLKRGLLEGAKGHANGVAESLPPTPSTNGKTPANGLRHSRHVELFSESDDDILLPGRHVAAKVARSHELWILARVVSYNPMMRTYEVEDVDSGEDEEEPASEEATEGGETTSVTTPAAAQAASGARRHHIVPRDQVKALPAETLPGDAWIHYSMGQRVMAVYPNTTSFYSAVVRVPNPKGAPYVLVCFDDDADEFGSHAPDRKIPFRFVVAL